MTSRPYVTVQLVPAAKADKKAEAPKADAKKDGDKKKAVGLTRKQAEKRLKHGSSIPLPHVFTAPIRLDIVKQTFKNVNKNNRQAYAVSQRAGHQTSAESWGTGRAVARIPRVAGGGTHRAGQGAFGNMCRGGRLFQTTKTWRRWTRLTNLNERRYAVVSSLAASAIVPLVMARGHAINSVPEIPLVVHSSAFDSAKKTKDAVKIFKQLGAWDDIEKSKNTRKVRSGKGKSRNRRYVQKLGPLVVVNPRATPDAARRAIRNVPGIKIASVFSLALRDVAPGGHIGRFIVWTTGAFLKLDKIWGTFNKPAVHKAGYRLPRHMLTTTDISKIVNSEEVRSVIRPKRARKTRARRHRPNPLKNNSVMAKLNPYAIILKRRAILKSRQPVTPEQKAANKKTRLTKRWAEIKKGKGLRKAWRKLISS